MIILSNKPTKNGSPIQGKCIMLCKDGTVFPCIDHRYHPNPGTESDQYSEIERTVDWLYANNVASIIPVLDSWINHRVAGLVAIGYRDIGEITLEVMYSDIYEPCSSVKTQILQAFDACCDSKVLEKYLSIDELDTARIIATFVNETFLRVRAGGKLNPCDTDSIYFRISSHGFNWYARIIEFLAEVFHTVENMPSYIWIGHDAETNPPETVLFDGSPDELFRMGQVNLC